MFLELELPPRGYGGTSLVFSWDPISGDVRGRHAEEVRSLAAAAQAAGVVTGLPYPTPHAISDPLHSVAEMAVVLGNLWRLPPELAMAYPDSQGDTPEGAVS